MGTYLDCSGKESHPDFPVISERMKHMVRSSGQVCCINWKSILQKLLTELPQLCPAITYLVHLNLVSYELPRKVSDMRVNSCFRAVQYRNRFLELLFQSINPQEEQKLF